MKEFIKIDIEDNYDIVFFSIETIEGTLNFKKIKPTGCSIKAFWESFDWKELDGKLTAEIKQEVIDILIGFCVLQNARWEHLKKQKKTYESLTRVLVRYELSNNLTYKYITK